MTSRGDVVPWEKPRYYYENEDRHGNARRYFRKRLPGHHKYLLVRLHEEPGTAEFHEEFACAMSGRPYVKKLAAAERPQLLTRVVVPKSLRWLIEEYYAKCLTFVGYDDETKKVRKNIFKVICAERLDPDDPKSPEVGDLPFDIPQDNIIMLANRKALTTIDGANSWIKAFRQLLKWASTTTPKLLKQNVAKDIALFQRRKTDGWHTWTVDEISVFLQRWPVGTKQALALFLFLFTGQRLSDVAKFGKQHIRRPDQISEDLRKIHGGRWLSFRQHKNRNSKPVDLVIPILPVAEKVMTDSKVAGVLGTLTFLETEFGKPYTTKGLGNWFGDACLKAAVPGRAHGLRKAGATIAAENGATPHQLMSIFGWSTLQQAEVYTKKVRQQKLAGAAMFLLLLTDQTGNECGSPLLGVAKSEPLRG